jgi:hypothetical protein
MHRLAILLLVLGAAVEAGCNSAPSGPPLAPAEGVVLLDGKPLSGADLMFQPQGETKGQAGYGRTDAAGKFALTTPDTKRNGAAVGAYRVTINKMVKPDGSDFVPDPNSGPEDTGGFKQILPLVYSDMEQTRLNAEIPAGGKKDLEFKLNSKAR